MKFSEFKERLGAEPRGNDPEMLAARRSGEEFEQAALEAEALENRIEATLNFKVDSDEVLGRVLATPSIDRRPRFNWMARAASVLIIVGLVSVAWYQSNQPSTLEGYVQSHYQHDGQEILASNSANFDARRVNEVLANFGAAATPELAEQVGYIKICPTLHANGAHMVLATENGPVTVLYMPDLQVENATLIRFDNMSAEVVNLDQGSAAIIYPEGQSISGLDTLLRGALVSSGADI